ncbi:conserved protein of unknown function [Magnetospirillum gryphiswaldense MSR-1 v2]|uniref:Uncharacterized protein n=1 Tax=Magnetospirillum gryphiswaldense (strain DSM 6361 / JCM 21280 / NBRC 15271 / MSR-1) TaxID=431944 RepID=V6EZ29_MAGGM|nr:hypothetical protein [Magnetospirillum gryphiswaldense]CDK97488.1 conserved protein of unknown function [Magnetospirillum gryphiswaldense MSR-1 v2]
MFGGAFMMGAKDRLLPPAIPFRFFATAIVYHLAAWAVLLWAADGLPGYRGGLGPVLAALHLITLGVLAMTAMGAAYQMLPVATRRQLGPAWACSLSWWLFAPGVAVLSFGLADGVLWALHGGASLAIGGLALFGGLVARNLMRVSDLPAVTGPVWVALASLLAVLVLAGLLIVDVGQGFLPDRASLAAAHGVLAGYGFMGMLVMGFSAVLVPMFVLAPAIPDAQAKPVVMVAAMALAAGAGGAVLGWAWLAGLAALVGLVAALLYLRLQRRVLAARMRKRLEPFFRLLKGGWVMLPLSLLAAAILALGPWPHVSGPVWGLLLVVGWLLSFATGILQRIMPFLASMHSAARGGKPVLLSHLTAQPVLMVHAAAHAGALALLLAAIGLDSPLIARLGALCGLAGALAFAVFAIIMMVRYRAHHRSQ